MSKCPFFGRCGGCKFDFASPDYCANKHALLKDFPLTDKPVWIKAGLRRRADFCFGGGVCFLLCLVFFGVCVVVFFCCFWDVCFVCLFSVWSVFLFFCLVCFFVFVGFLFLVFSVMVFLLCFCSFWCCFLGVC